MKITIIRHGQTNFNKEGFLNATTDIDLNKTGKEQARLTNKYLNKKFNKIYSSTKIRAKNTAKIITKNDNKNKLIEDIRLIERDYGIFEGKPYYEVKEELNKLNKVDYKKFEMEEIKNFKNRISQFLKQHIILKENIGKEILIVSHSGTIKMLVYQLLKLTKNYKEFKNSIKLNNCSITTIEFETINKIKSDVIGFDEHLKELK